MATKKTDKYNLSERLKGTQYAKNIASKSGTDTKSSDAEDRYNLRERLSYSPSAEYTAAGASSRRSLVDTISAGVEKAVYRPLASEDEGLTGMGNRAQFLVGDIGKDVKAYTADVIGKYKAQRDMDIGSQAIAGRASAMARARSGDMNVLNGREDDPNYDLYKRLLRLSGYDDVTRAFGATALPEEWQRDGVTTYADLFGRQVGYDANQMGRDFQDVEVLSQGAGDSKRYMDASGRLAEYFGGDWSAEAVNERMQEGGAGWYQELMKQYGLEEDVLREAYPIDEKGHNYDAYVAYMQDLAKQEQAQRDAQAHYDEWKAEFDSKWNWLSGVSDYEQYSGEIVDPAMLYPAQVMPDTLTAGYEYMTDEEKRRFSYLYNNPDFGLEGDDGAEQYLKDLQEDLWRRRIVDRNQKTAEFTGKNALTGALGWVAARGANLANGLVSGVMGLGAPMHALFGDEVSRYDPAFNPARMARTIDTTNQQGIAEKMPWAKIGRYHLGNIAYSGLSSLGDSIAAGWLYGPKGGAWSQALSAGGYELLEGLESGERSFVSNILDAFAVGAFEGLTEKFSMDALFKGGTSGVKNIVRNMLTEPSEEMANLLLNLGYDRARYGTDDDLGTRMSELRTQGYTESEARVQLLMELGGKALETALTAWVAGTAGGTVSAASTHAENKGIGKQIQENETTARLLEIAEGMRDMPDDVRALIEDQKAAVQAAQEAQRASETQYEEMVEEEPEAPEAAQEAVEEDTEEAAAEEMVEEEPEAPEAAREAVEEDTEEAAAEETTDTAEEVAPKKPDTKKKKTPQLNNAKLGRIYRETMSRLDEQAQNVLADTFGVKTMRRLIDQYSALDRVQADGPMRDVLAKTAAKAVVNAASLSESELNMLRSSKAATTAVREMTAAVIERGEVQKTAVELMGMATKGGAQLRLMTELPEELTPDGRTLKQYSEDYGNQGDIMLKAYESHQNAGQYAQQFRAAFNYGRDGRDVDSIIGDSKLTALTEKQIRTAYELGRDVRKQNASLQRKVNPTGMTVGNVDRSEISGMQLNSAQHTSVTALTRIAKIIGFNLKLVASTANAEGKYTSENGSWDRNTRTLTIDINAGRLSTESANYAMMQTAGHELTHYIKQFANSELYDEYQEFVLGHLSKKMGNTSLNARIASIVEGNAKQGKTLTREQAIDEIVADASGDALMGLTEADLTEMAQKKPGLLKTIGKFFEKWINSIKTLIRKGYEGQSTRNAVAEQMLDVADELGRKWAELLKNAQANAVEAKSGGDVAVDANGEVQFSLREDERLMSNAIAANGAGNVPANVLNKAKADRAKVAEFMRDDSRDLNLPADLMGNTFFSDAAYGGTEENTTVCPRSIGADAFLDAVSDKIGRPLTVAEQVLISQDVIGAANIKDPQCIYCYVAADRAAYREYLGRYIEQRDGVIDALKSGETDMDALYQKFLDGRKDTPNMKARFKLWANTYKSGKRLLSNADLANIGVLTAIQSDKYRQLSGDSNYAAQMKDALAYAQSASWAKKRINYVAYNGHILKWTQNRIDKLNSMYGLRMYSFSDFSPAFALENMQMVTDASVRGLKMLAYTKVPAFAEIFADTGMNINISVFATEVQGDSGSSIVENNLMGADWKAAQKLRDEHENIGITFVATSDAQVEWALAQPWIDVCIPYHLVRTGRTIAELMKYKNFTAESGDSKTPAWSKASGNLASIPAALHNNDRDTYMRLLAENNLEPRFARFVDNPNYMKLVNETRQSVTTSKPVQPVFNTDAAINALQDMANNGGYYVPIGGSEQRMYELADEFADKVKGGAYAAAKSADVQYSVRDGVEFLEHKYYSRFIDRLDEQKPGGYIKVGRVLGGGILNDVGLPEADLYFDVSKINKALYVDHSDHVDLDVLKQIPQILRDPVVIAEANTADTINVFGDVVAGNSPVMIGIVITKDRSGRNVINKVRTIHARRDFIKRITDENVLYLHPNKKRTRDWFQARGNVVPLGGTKFGFIRSIAQGDDSVNLQIRDPYQLTDREILANTMESVARNKDELDILRRYKARVAEYGEKQALLDKINANIARLTNEGGERDEIVKERNRAQILRNQIDRLDQQLAHRERTEAVKALAGRERQRVRAEQQKTIRTREVARLNKRLDDEKAKYDRMQERYQKQLAEQKQKVHDVREEKNESFARAKYLGEVQKHSKRLMDLLTTPTNKAYVPEFLRRPLADFITALDFRSVTQLEGGEATKGDERMKDAMAELSSALRKAHTQQFGENTTGAEFFSGYLDLPGDFLDNFDELMRKIRLSLSMSSDFAATPVNKMKSEQLHELAKAFRLLHSSIANMNRLIVNAKYASAVTAANDTITKLEALKAIRDQNAIMERVGSLFDWKNTVPYYVFQRFGDGGKAIFEGLMDGWDKLAHNSDELVKYANKVYQPQEVREWEKDVQSVELSSGETVRMTAAQMMSVYCLAKREQARGHLLGGGIRISDIDSKGKRIRQAQDYLLTEKDLKAIAAKLTERQREVADALQAYMNTKGSEWGNYVSMMRFGYEMFTEENYFPIETDPNNRKAQDETAEGQSLYRLLNMSATKALTKGANNAIIARSIFDVFTAHMTDMAKYNALALPLLDTFKWFNYVERTQNKDGTVETRSTQKAMETAYGGDARSYIMQFLKDLNGVHEGGRDDAPIKKLISNYKIAATAANIRVGILQVTSMPRAAYAINPKYLLAGLAKWNTSLGKASKAAAEEIGIAKWKSMGFYDTNISRSVRQMVKHDESGVEKGRGWSAKLAEWGDAWTMGVIYGAVEAEMKDKHGALKPGTKAYKELMNRRMREIIYQTQVVDSTMTRSQLMRDTHGLMQLATSFMSEPTLAMNMLNDAIFEAKAKARAGQKEWFPAALPKVTRAFGATTFVIGMSSLIEAFFTAFRDDDEFETFAEKYVQALWGENFWDGALGGNINLLNNLPILKNLIEAVRGISADAMWTAAVETLSGGITGLWTALVEGGSQADIYRNAYKTLQGASQLTGLAASNAVRDLVALYNTVLAEPMGWKRLQTYENTPKDAAKAIYAASLRGDTDMVKFYRERAALYGIDEEDISKKLEKLIEDDIQAGKIDSATAGKLLKGEAGKRDREVADIFTEAEYLEATGLELGDMKQDFIDGVLTESQVKSYRVTYGTNQDSDSVAATLGEWKYEKDTGRLYSEMKLDYADGIISEKQVRNYLAKYGGKNEEKIEETISNYDYWIATGKTNAPKYWRIAYAHETGGNYRKLIEDAMVEIIAGGRTEKQARSQIASSLKSYYAEEYLAIEGTAAGKRMLEDILDVYEALGYSRDYQRQYIAENWFD